MSSKLVDQRVVEMQFDNRNFERNVNESIKSIEKLKMSLDFSAVEVAAISAISNITNKLTDMGLNLAKSLSIDQLTSGWTKFESKSKSVGTLLAQGIGMEEIQESIEKLQWFTDETSYSFQEMFNTITKFQAAGLSLEKSTKTVEGIALAAAAVGQNAQVASQAMYQLQQAIPSGYIKYRDWQEGFVNRNMSSTEIQQYIADIASAMADGTSTLTKITNEAGETMYKTVSGAEYKLEELFGHTLTEELWLTADIFTEAMSKMTEATEPIKDAVDSLELTAADATKLLKTLQSDITNLSIEDLAKEYGIAAENIGELKRISEDYNQTVSEQAIKFFQSAQECRTLGDAIGAVKEAVSSDWSLIWENIFGDYEQGKTLWTNIFDNLYTMFVEPMNRTLKTVEEWKQMGGWNDLFEFDEENNSFGALFNVLNSIQDILDLIGGSWRKVFSMGGNAFKSFTQKLKEGTAYLRLSEDSLERLQNVFVTAFKILQKGLNVVKKLFSITKPIIKVLVRILDSLLTIVDALATKISEFMEKNDILIKVLNILGAIVEKICDGFLQLSEALSNVIVGFYNAGKNINTGLIGGIKEGFRKVKDFIIGFANAIVNWFNTALDIHSPSRVFKESGENIVKGLIEGIKDKYKLLKEAIVKFLEGPLTEFGHKLEGNWLIGPILEMFKNIHEVLKTIGQGFYDAGKDIYDNSKLKIRIENIKKEKEQAENLNKILKEQKKRYEEAQKVIDRYDEALKKTYTMRPGVMEDAQRILKEEFDKAQEALKEKRDAEVEAAKLQASKEASKDRADDMAKVEFLQKQLELTKDLQTQDERYAFFYHKYLGDESVEYYNKLFKKAHMYGSWIIDDQLNSLKEDIDKQQKLVDEYTQKVKENNTNPDLFDKYKNKAKEAEKELKRLTYLYNDYDKILNYTAEKQKDSKDIIIQLETVFKYMSEGLINASTALKNFGEGLQNEDKTMKGTILNTLGRIIITLSTVLQILGNIADRISKSKVLQFISSVYTKATDFVNTFLIKFNELLQSGEKFSTALGESLKLGIQSLKTADKAVDAAENAADKAADAAEQVANTAADSTEKVTDVAASTETAIEKVFGIFENNIDRFSAILAGTLDIISYVAEKIDNLIGTVFDDIIKKEEKFVEDDTLGGVFDNLERIYDALSGTIGKFITFIENALGKIADALTVGVEGESSPLAIFFDSLLNLLQAFLNMLSKILPIITGVIDKFTELLNGMNVKEESPFVQALYDLINNMCGIITAIIERFAEFFKEIKDNISTMEEGSGILKAVIKALPFLAIVLLLKYLFENLTIIGRGIKMVKNMGWVLDSMSELMYGVALYAKGMAIKALADSIFTIAKALVILSVIDLKSIGKGALVVAGFLAIVIGLAVALNKWFVNIQKVESASPAEIIKRFKTLTSGYAQMAGMMAALGGALLMVTAAITMLARELSPNQGETPQQAAGRVWQAVAIMIIAVGTITTAMILMNKFMKITNPALTKNMLGLAASIGILAGSMMILANIWKYNKAGFGMGIAAIVAFSGILVGLSAALKYLYVAEENTTNYTYGDPWQGTSETKLTKGGMSGLASTLISISLAILSLSAALVLVTWAFQISGGPGPFWEAVGVIAIFSGILLGITAALTALTASIQSRGLDPAKLPEFTQFIKSISGFLLAFAAATALITGSIALIALSFNKLGAGSTIAAIATFALLIVPMVGALALGVYELSKQMDKIDTSKMTNLMESILALSTIMAAITILIAAMAVAFKYLGGWNVIGAVATISAVIVGMVFLLKALRRLNETQSYNLYKLRDVFIGLAIVIGAMTASLIAIALMYNYLNQNGEVIWAVGTMAALVFVFIGLVYALQELNKSSKGVEGLKNTLLNLVPVVVALLALVGAVYLLVMASKDVNPKGLLITGAVFAALGGVLVGLIFLGKVAKSIEWTAIAKIAAMGGILLLIVAAFSGALMAINSMSDLLNNPDAVKNFAIIVGVLSAALIVIAAIGALGTYVGPGMLIISVALLALSGSLLVLGKALQAFMGLLKEFSTTGAAEIVAGFHNLVEGLKGSIEDIRELLVLAATFVVDFFDSLLAKVNEWFENGGMERIVQLVVNIVETFFVGLIEGIYAMASHIGELVNALRVFLHELNTALGVEAEGDENMPLLAYITKMATVAILQTVNGLLDALKEHLPGTVTKLVELIALLIAELGTQIGILVDGIIKFIINLLDGVGTAFKNNAGELHRALVEFRDNMVTALIDILFGQGTADKFKEGLKGLFSKIGDTIGEVFDGAKELGKKAVDGVVSGVKSVGNGVKKAGEWIGGLFKDGTEEELDIHSPSRVMAQVGAYAVEGLVQGIEAESDDVTIAGEDLANKMTSAIAEVADAMNSDLSQEDLTIRPVLDLTEIQNGTAQMASMLNGVDTSVQTNLNNARYAAREFNNNKANAAIPATSEDISRLGDSMNGGGDTINATFNITGDNPQEIAKEVEKIIENQILRRNINRGGLTSL